MSQIICFFVFIENRRWLDIKNGSSVMSAEKKIRCRFVWLMPMLKIWTMSNEANHAIGMIAKCFGSVFNKTIEYMFYF